MDCSDGGDVMILSAIAHHAGQQRALEANALAALAAAHVLGGTDRWNIAKKAVVDTIRGR